MTSFPNHLSSTAMSFCVPGDAFPDLSQQTILQQQFRDRWRSQGGPMGYLRFFLWSTPEFFWNATWFQHGVGCSIACMETPIAICLRIWETVLLYYVSPIWKDIAKIDIEYAILVSSIQYPWSSSQVLIFVLQAWSIIEGGLCRALSSYVTNNFNRTGRARPGACWASSTCILLNSFQFILCQDWTNVWTYFLVSFHQCDPTHGHCPVKEGERRNGFSERACQSKASGQNRLSWIWIKNIFLPRVWLQHACGFPSIAVQVFMHEVHDPFFSISVITWATGQELGMLSAKGKKIPTRGRSTNKKARGPSWQPINSQPILIWTNHNSTYTEDFQSHGIQCHWPDHDLQRASQVTAGSSTKRSGSSKPQAAKATQPQKKESEGAQHEDTQPTDEPTPKKKLESEFASCAHDEPTREGAEEEQHTDDEVVEPCTPHHPAMYTKIDADEQPDEQTVEPSQSQQLPSPQRVSVVDSDEEMDKGKKNEVKGTFKDHTITDDRRNDFDLKAWIYLFWYDYIRCNII